MKRNVGVWIDHRKAVIIRITDEGEEIHSVDSGVEKHVRYAGGAPEDRQEHRFANELKEFYARVISFLRDEDSILILGPGEAKGEFEKRLSVESLGGRIVGIETLDKMSYHEIAKKVREHFLHSGEGIQQDKKH